MKRTKLFHSAVMETSVALESIDFQPTAFPDALALAAGQLIEKAEPYWFGWRMKDKGTEQLTAMEMIIKQYTGLNVKMVVSPDAIHNAWVEFGPTNHNSVLFNEIQQAFSGIFDASKMLEMIENNDNKSTVDISKATVTGMYAKLNSTITVTFGLLKSDKITGERLAAIIMHEIGHLFALYEYTNRQVRTNQVMAAVVIANRDRASVKEFQTVLVKASKVLGGNGTEFKDVQNAPDSGVAIATVVLDAGSAISKSALGIPEYDYTSFEMLADQFVSRHRYGRHLLEALDTLPKQFGENILISRYELQIAGMIPFIKVGSYLATAIGAGLAGPITAIVYLVIAGLVTYNNSDVQKDYTYDDLKVRFKRIREQSVALLKMDEPSPETKEIIENIKAMDKVIDKTYIPPNYLRSIVRYFSKNNRSIAETIQFQRDMEELVHNDLFLKAKELQTL